MSAFVLLTQDGCAGCERLKLMLAKPLGGQFDEQIRLVHRQSQPQEFETLAARYGIQSLPALLHLPSGRRLADTSSLGAVKAFLELEVVSAGS